jgi:hypothetical protein
MASAAARKGVDAGRAKFWDTMESKNYLNWLFKDQDIKFSYVVESDVHIVPRMNNEWWILNNE